MRFMWRYQIKGQSIQTTYIEADTEFQAKMRVDENIRNMSREYTEIKDFGLIPV